MQVENFSAGKEPLDHAMCEPAPLGLRVLRGFAGVYSILST
jgi:hypothetical protein